jgi:hypothetical protein
VNRHMKGALFAAAGTAAVMAAAMATGCSRQPRTAEEVIARSVAAHGGERLTNWRTLSINGTVEMQDGITYKAAYVLQASLPGRLRVEQDMTADRGRIFNEYFLNDGVAWSRRNLIPGRGDAARMQRWMNQCYGIAYYLENASGLALEADGEATWREPPAGGGEERDAAVSSRPAWVVSASVGEETVKLYIDKKTFHFLEEATPHGRRLFSGFKTFDGAVLPTKILEITTGRQGDVFTPYTYESVAFDAPIEDWVFTEDMPAAVKQ